MARFPETEAAIVTLAHRIATGLIAAREDFPSPPVSPEELLAQLDAFQADDGAAVAARAQAKAATVAKKKSLKALKVSMRATLRYAEYAVPRRRNKLGALGWGPPRARRALTAPGEVRDITIKKEGDTWLVLAWKSPRTGGEVAAFLIERRTAGHPWQEVASSAATMQLLSDQPRGVELEFRVLATNRAGTGRPSGTVTAVL